jgi:branched-chain amino acid transport system permease protein
VRGDYLTIVTLGFSEIIRLAFCNLPSICNAAMGLRGIPKQANLLWTWGIALLTIFVTKRLVDSNYGRALKAISEDEIAAEALGVNLFHYKLLAFVVSSFFVGLAGSILAQVLGTIDPATFRLTLTYAALTIVVLGGIRSLTGTVIAAGIYTISSEWLRTVESPRKILGIQIPGVPGMRVIFFAVLLLLLILYRRTGLLGEREFSWDGLSAWFRSMLPGRRRAEVES